VLLFEITLGLVGLGLLTLALGVKHLGVRTVRERTVRGLGLVFGVRVGLLSTELVLRLGFWVTVRLGLATGQMCFCVVADFRRRGLDESNKTNRSLVMLCNVKYRTKVCRKL